MLLKKTDVREWKVLTRGPQVRRVNWEDAHCSHSWKCCCYIQHVNPDTVKSTGSSHNWKHYWACFLKNHKDVSGTYIYMNGNPWEKCYISIISHILSLILGILRYISPKFSLGCYSSQTVSLKLLLFKARSAPTVNLYLRSQTSFQQLCSKHDGCMLITNGPGIHPCSTPPSPRK